MIGLLVALLVVVPHPDDEIPVIPEIVAHGDVVVMVLTDGAATSHCPMPTACESARRASFEGFMSEVAPHARLMWIGSPDGELTPERAAFYMVNVCVGCDLLVGGVDYGHDDHNAVFTAGRWLRAATFDHEPFTDPVLLAAVQRWYGWLGVTGREDLVGLGS